MSTSFFDRLVILLTACCLCLLVLYIVTKLLIRIKLSRMMRKKKKKEKQRRRNANVEIDLKNFSRRNISMNSFVNQSFASSVDTNLNTIVIVNEDEDSSSTIIDLPLIMVTDTDILSTAVIDLESEGTDEIIETLPRSNSLKDEELKRQLNVSWPKIDL